MNQFEQKAIDNWNALSWMYIRKALLDAVQGAMWLYFANSLKSGGWWPVWIMAAVFVIGMYLTFRKGRQEEGYPFLEIAETLAAVIAGVAASFVAIKAVPITQISFVTAICFFWAALDVYHPMSWVVELFGGGNLAAELTFHSSISALDKEEFKGYKNSWVKSVAQNLAAKAAQQK